MERHAWIMFLLGIWMTGLVAVGTVATQNFRTIDRLIALSPNPAFRTSTDRLGTTPARDLLRYLSSELNRLYFRLWNRAELVLGILLLWLVRRERGMVRWAAGVMLAIAIANALYFIPQIVEIGRRLDFVPRDVPPPDLARFWTLHGLYLGLDLTKLLLAVGIAVVTARRRF